MSLRSFLSFAFLLLVATVPAIADCEPDGDVQFLCGPVSPEDLLAVPGTPWVIVSSLASEVDNEGLLHAADTRDLSTTALYPSASSEPAFDADTYGACPGPNTSNFIPHGVSLRPGTGEIHTLYVVRHGGREAIEVFDADFSGAVPSLTWVGCVPAPQGVGFNSVTYLPDGRVAATNFQFAGGEVWVWQPGSEWSKVPGSNTPGANGLLASRDGRWLYVGGWATNSVVRISLGMEPVQIDSVDVGFHVDNLRWTPLGKILAAGQDGPNPAAIGACIQRQCDGVTAHIARVDPRTLEAERLVDYPSNDRFLMGTVAIQVGDELWMGGIAESDHIARFALP